MRETIYDFEWTRKFSEIKTPQLLATIQYYVIKYSIKIHLLNSCHSLFRLYCLNSFLKFIFSDIQSCNQEISFQNYQYKDILCSR